MLPLILSVYFALAPSNPYGTNETPAVVYRIAECESGGQEYNSNGSLVRDHVTGTHIGIYQLAPKWVALAKTMGIDATTPVGNIEMAIWLMNQHPNYSDWDSSKGCWGSADG